ncbi:U1 snRNP protein, partial [Spiromyces aspiralis]
MRAVINNPLYRSLKTLAERKEAFYKYIADKKARQRRELMAQIEARRESFFEVLRSLPITEYTRYNKVAKLTADNPINQAVPDLRERLDFFGEYIGRLRKDLE